MPPSFSSSVGAHVLQLLPGHYATTPLAVLPPCTTTASWRTSTTRKGPSQLAPSAVFLRALILTRSPGLYEGPSFSCCVMLLPVLVAFLYLPLLLGLRLGHVRLHGLVQPLVHAAPRVQLLLGVGCLRRQLPPSQRGRVPAVHHQVRREAGGLLL